MTRRALPQVPESLLARLWQARAARAGAVTARDGRRLRVLYPGRHSSAAGPDFRDAVLQDEAGRLLNGDVEVHVHASDWHAHGHDRDPHYDGVAVHAVLHPDGAEARSAAGRVPVVVALGPLSYPEAVRSAPVPSHWERLAALGFPRPRSLEEAGILLGEAGDARFLQRSAALAASAEAGGIGQAAYERFMEALGYSQNRAGFLELARRVPYEAARRAALDGEQAVLGLLLQGAVGIRWQAFRIRPANHPRRRMAGAALLLARHARDGMVDAFRRLALDGEPGTLERALVVVKEGLSLVGPDRAADISVNVALPCVHALAITEGDASLAAAALRVYARFRSLQENELTREAVSELLPPGWERVARGARRQQGLLHLYRLMSGTAPAPAALSSGFAAAETGSPPVRV